MRSPMISESRAISACKIKRKTRCTGSMELYTCHPKIYWDNVVNKIFTSIKYLAVCKGREIYEKWKPRCTCGKTQCKILRQAAYKAPTAPKPAVLTDHVFFWFAVKNMWCHLEKELHSFTTSVIGKAPAAVWNTSPHPHIRHLFYMPLKTTDISLGMIMKYL